MEHGHSWVPSVDLFALLEMPSICSSMALNSDPGPGYFLPNQSFLQPSFFLKGNILSFLQTCLTTYVNKVIIYFTSWKRQCKAVDRAKEIITSRFEFYFCCLVVVWPWTSYLPLWTSVFPLNNGYNVICLNWVFKGRNILHRK